MDNENTPQEPSLEDILSFQDDSVYSEDGFNDNAPAEGGEQELENNTDEGQGQEQEENESHESETGEETQEPEINEEEFQQQLLNNFGILKDNGVLVTPEDFEFDGTADKFKEALEHSKKAYDDNAKERLMQKLPDAERRYFEYLVNGGDDLEEFQANYIDYDSVDMSSEEVQKQVIAHQYKTTTRFSDERIQKLIDRSVSDGSLLDDATEAMSLLKSEQASKQQEILEANQRKAQARLEKEADFRNNVTTSISELDYLTAERQKKVKNFYVNPVTKSDGQKTEFTRVMDKLKSNPTHLAQLADILYEYNEKDGLNLDRLSKLKLSKKTKDFRTSIHEALNTKVNVASKGSTPPSKEKFDFEAFLKSQ
jgi:polyhydroxyalkanoate synthesis regulator phasin